MLSGGSMSQDKMGADSMGAQKHMIIENAVLAAELSAELQAMKS